MKETKELKKLRSYTCRTCHETRDLLSWYDTVHSVWVLSDLSIIVDHGEAESRLT